MLFTGPKEELIGIAQRLAKAGFTVSLTAVDSGQHVDLTNTENALRNPRPWASGHVSEILSSDVASLLRNLWLSSNTNKENNDNSELEDSSEDICSQSNSNSSKSQYADIWSTNIQKALLHYIKRIASLVCSLM